MVEPWKRIEPTKVVAAAWRSIVTKTFLMPDGTTAEFDTLYKEGQRYASVLALTADNQVIIARQFRPGPEAIWDEIPGGGVEDGEEPEAAAERELREETGYEAAKLTLLGSSKQDAYFNAEWFYFLAEGCVRRQDQNLDDHEYVEIALIPITDLLQNAKAGKMSDSHGVLLAYDKLKEIQGGK